MNTLTMTPRRYPKSFLAALQQMRRTMTRPQIAKAFGCSEKALHRTIERFKLGPVPRA